MPFDAPLRPSFVALGEAPGPDEDVRGTPFVGRSGKLLRATLRDAGFNDGEMMFANTVSCFPNDKSKIRAPTQDEMMACRGNLMDQLELAGTRYVLFCGATALKAFRDDLKVSQVHGQVFIWESRWAVMPVYHPAGILRQRHLADAWYDDLVKWKDIVREETSALSALSMTCSRCGDWAEWHDPDGVGFCTRHWKRYGDSWKTQRARWGTQTQTKTVGMEMEQGSLI